jgi:hypothetical protein
LSEQFYQNAGRCLKDVKLLQSLHSYYHLSKRRDRLPPGGDPTFTRSSAPDFMKSLDPMDPGWTMEGDNLTARCNVPLRVDGQEMAFSECARVYACGYYATECGVERAEKSDTTDCVSISRTCLAQNPIPQRSVTRSASPQIESVPQTPEVGLSGNKSSVSGSTK